MGALAFLLMEKGHRVSGSDLKQNAMTSRLKEAGADISACHAAENINDADVVVYSSAIKEENPELKAARALGKEVLRRAQLLAQLMENQTGVTVAGAHGKTTTSSMLAALLTKTGFHPTIAVGGIPMETSSNAGLGEGKYFVAEVDESDGTFLYFSPKYSVITNIDYEHVDHYKDFNDLLKCYRQFIEQTQPDGAVIACGDDPNVRQILSTTHVSYVTYGESPDNDFHISDYSCDGRTAKFKCYQKGAELGQVALNVLGKHNALNALASVIVGLQLEIPFSKIADALKTFRGVQRRFQLKGDVGGIRVIDDYAHHPAEIACVLSTVESLCPENLIVVFQPHRYSRLQAFRNDFIKVLSVCPNLLVTDVYAASELPIEGISGGDFAKNMRQAGYTQVQYVVKEQITEYLTTHARRGDIVLMLGAGDITDISQDFVEALRQKSGSDAPVKIVTGC